MEQKKSACVKLMGALTTIIFCCCSEVLTFHEESNFKKDESIIPNNTGIISLNDLYLVMRRFQPYYPKSGLITAMTGAYIDSAAVLGLMGWVACKEIKPM